MQRRDFIKTTGVFASGLTMAGGSTLASDLLKDKFTSYRPAVGERKFTSKAVEKVIKQVAKKIGDDELRWMFVNCYPNTLDTTVEFTMNGDRPDTFVITGDIPAMWLRDSTAQVWPYLPLANDDDDLKLMIKGLVNRQAACVLLDPYANAFEKDPTVKSKWAKTDITDMKPGTHERKWEIDSLCYAVRLANGYWKKTGDASIFDETWQKSTRLIVKTFKEQQRKDGVGPYTFSRVTQKYEDTMANWGAGASMKTCGLIVSSFRPSDDSTLLPFLIPSNYFAVASLMQLADIYANVVKDNAFADECIALAEEVKAALKKYAVKEHLDFGEILPFEVDGYGNQYFMDDANVPSLLSMPYLDCMDVNDPLYQATRKFVWSESNPYFFKGKFEGIGGPHVGLDYVWPMSIIQKGLTSQDPEEMKWCLDQLKATHADTGFMHESFHKDDPKKYTRSWFAWTNTLFGELVYKVYQQHPELLK
ncbi:glycoside hydrolase family 125 protein [Flammeovirga pectinis]|uniref:Glycoside hydrolase family 125 protein n=1 Tax=Flammeovirga pectinis TaxID=2494373 RepID=A0A3S9P0A0_9BACT|nr:glycoside hydrolase family 125 protein [Flammeovirga pectinis]AZQ61619.1 glycoside hydrolase family 125 protein [Flammeovirga pectinis]